MVRLCPFYIILHTVWLLWHLRYHFLLLILFNWFQFVMLVFENCNTGQYEFNAFT